MMLTGITALRRHQRQREQVAELRSTGSHSYEEKVCPLPRVKKKWAAVFSVYILRVGGEKHATPTIRSRSYTVRARNSRALLQLRETR